MATSETQNLDKMPAMERDEFDQEVFEHFRKAYEPTKADIEREISYEDQVLLCRKKKCRVLMYKWNPVANYAQHFKERGRLEGKSVARINKLLAKNVNKFKRHRNYDNEIKEFRQSDWAYRKKENLMWLDLVKSYRTVPGPNSEEEESHAESGEFDQFYGVDTESMSLGSQSVRIDLETQKDAPLFATEEAYENFHAEFTSTQNSQPRQV